MFMLLQCTGMFVAMLYLETRMHWTPYRTCMIVIDGFSIYKHGWVACVQRERSKLFGYSKLLHSRIYT